MLRAGEFELLVNGGQEHEIPAFVEFLPRELSTRVAGTFSIDGSAILGDIKSRAQGVLDRYERDEEAAMVADILDRNAMGGLATVGLTDCLWAGSVSAVQTLLVQEGAVVGGVACDQSDWLAESGQICPIDGSQTRYVPDVIDELVTSVIEAGGSIEHVQAETELADLLVAAQLRFPLPPRP
jgi:peptide subunit release factor 1 (eRF1)